MKRIFTLFALIIVLISCNNSNTSKILENKVNKQDSIVIKNIFNTVLTNGQSYQWLDYLSNEIGGRLSGSHESIAAILWGERLMQDLRFDKVWLQDVMVPNWYRGEKEEANFTSNTVKYNVPICALGGSIPTPTTGITGEVIEVQSLEDIESLGEKLRGKIVFFNRPFDNTHIQTFKAYGGCVNQRYAGAMVCGKFGALAAIVRSMTSSIDDYPHTGSMYYDGLTLNQRIPAAAISTNGAQLLSSMLSLNADLDFYLKQDCRNFPDVPSHNVVGEIKGSEFPDEIIVVGGHLDSWDLGDGAHDDGAGIVQSMEVLRLFKAMKYIPKRTIRVVLYMNEENGLRGGKAYAKYAKNNKENHIFALESDAGGFSPRGFVFEASPEQFNQVSSWKTYFEPYLANNFKLGGSGADIGPLRNGKIVLSGLRPDSQRYFDHHHAANDTFDAINKRELELGAAAMASLVYLVDQYGF